MTNEAELLPGAPPIRGQKTAVRGQRAKLPRI
jgi:hypothetical protein